MATEQTLSIIMPAYNEAGNLAEAAKGTLLALQKFFQDYELIIVNDGSSDETGKIAEALASQNSRIRVLHHQKNQGIGAAYRTGLQAARYTFVGLIPGDNEIAHASIEAIFKTVGSADIIVAYRVKEKVRSWYRDKLSQLWTFSLNSLFGLRLKYYNGPCVYRMETALQLTAKTESFGFFAATLIRSLKAGHSYQEVPFHLQPRIYGKSKAFKFSNLYRSLLIIAKLYWELG